MTACDVNPEAVARFEAGGGRAAANPAAAATSADVVICVVVNAAQTEAVLFGADGAAATMREGAVFVSSATMDPAIARRLASRLEETGRHYLDAPMSGGAARAATGNSPSWPPARRPPSTRPGRPWRPWRASSTNSATRQGRALPSR